MATDIFAQLDHYASADRPAAVVQVLRQLAGRAGRDLVLIARLAHEAHEGGYWSKVARADGQPYLDEESFFADVLQVVSWRTALKRIALGRALAAVTDDERERVADQLAALGVARATILTPVLETAPQETGQWIERAAALSQEELQQAVSQELGAKPRGRAGGDHVATFLRAAMPSIETRELFDEWLRVGRRVTGSESALGVLIEGMRECVAEWHPRLAAKGEE